MTNDNFADAPLSIGEIRSNKERDASKWTVREALVHTLREIDNGRFDATDCCICLAGRHTETDYEEGERSITYVRVAGTSYETIGLLEDVKFKLLRG